MAFIITGKKIAFIRNKVKLFNKQYQNKLILKQINYNCGIEIITRI